MRPMCWNLPFPEDAAARIVCKSMGRESNLCIAHHRATAGVRNIPNVPRGNPSQFYLLRMQEPGTV